MNGGERNKRGKMDTFNISEKYLSALSRNLVASSPLYTSIADFLT